MPPSVGDSPAVMAGGAAAAVMGSPVVPVAAVAEAGGAAALSPGEGAGVAALVSTETCSLGAALDGVGSAGAAACGVGATAVRAGVPRASRLTGGVAARASDAGADAPAAPGDAFGCAPAIGETAAGSGARVPAAAASVTKVGPRCATGAPRLAGESAVERAAPAPRRIGFSVEGGTSLVASGFFRPRRMMTPAPPPAERTCSSTTLSSPRLRWRFARST